MVGTQLDGRGGISSVVACYQNEGMFERLQIVYLAAHRSGSGIAKLVTMFGSLARLWGMLLRRRVALVHIHTASNGSFWRKTIFAASTMFFARPVLMHIHGGGFETFGRGLGALPQRLMSAVLSRSRVVIVLSRSWIDRLSPLCPEARWLAIANPVILRPAPQRALDPARVEVLFLGRLEQVKGVFDLVQAFAQIHLQAPQLRLVIAGEGDRQDVLRIAQKLGVESKIEFVGWIDGALKDEYLDRCEIFALPSHLEGLPVSLLEAMAAGQAVIVSAVGSVPEVVTHGRDGWLVPVGEVEPLACALLYLASNPVAREQLGGAARVLVENCYAAPRVCARLEQLYKEVAGDEHC
jgi:glycosyltransferase involved in cell wall biosynthesis